MQSRYAVTVKKFQNCEADTVVGILSQQIAELGICQQYSKQIYAWKKQVEVLKKSLHEIIESVDGALKWTIVFEYQIPRRQKRPDVIILTDNVIFIVEFKFGATDYDAASRWQVEDYALNIRDFHAESSGRIIVPVLCATNAHSMNEYQWAKVDGSAITSLVKANSKNLGTLLGTTYCELKKYYDGKALDASAWLSSAYRPTLNIIEAAEELYVNHSVRDLSHCYADNLVTTTDMVAKAIMTAKHDKKRTLILITGVPGAGKTLAGLNVVHDSSIRFKQGTSGIFLSGNGPLVKIIKKALVNNQMKAGRRKIDAEHEVSTFIQNVHQFLRYHRENPKAIPHEHVVVFDEAQRAWDQRQMKRKQGVDYSEPYELLSVMERTHAWAVVIGLVGGGQEIYTGEAGLKEWGRALKATSKDWDVIASPEVMSGGSSVAGHKLFEQEVPPKINIKFESVAHLAVNVRSHRAQQLAEWVNCLLEPDASAACNYLPELREFPLYVTRNLKMARRWLRLRSDGDYNKRCGLVCSSEAKRLRADGLENSKPFRDGYAFDKWFLASADDVRSSFSLEVPATEFECQGLELEYVGVCWGGDLTLGANRSSWDFRKFHGAGWRDCDLKIEQDYIRNRYRVLLTRARAGMIIWVPPGCKEDPTRPPEWFDRVYEHFRKAGVSELLEFERGTL